MPGDRSAATEIALLLGLVAAPFALSPPIAAAGAAGLLVLWLRQRGHPRREILAGAVGFGAACALLAASTIETARAPEREATARRAVDAGAEAFWDRLAATADAAAAALPPPPYAGATVREAFAVLERAAATGPFPELSFLLLDPGGEALAWSGPGLVHEIRPAALPEGGVTFLQSVTSASALAVAAVADPSGGTPHRLVAGISRSRDGSPPLLGAVARRFRGAGWMLDEPEREGGRPRVLIDPAARAAPALPARELARAAAFAAAAAAAALAVLRGVGLALLRGSVVRRRHPRWAVAATGGLGVLALAGAAGAHAPAVAALAGGLAAGYLGWTIGREGRAPRLGVVSAAAAGPAAALLARAPTGASDLASGLFGGGDAMALRLALAALGFGAVAAGAGRRDGRLAGVAFGVALAAALAATVTVDLLATALVATALAGAAAALGASPRRLRSAFPLAGLALLATLVTAAGWSAGQRARLQAEGERRVASLRPPEAGAMVRLRTAAAISLTRAAGELARDEPRTESGDLAFGLWRASALARGDLLSAVVVSRGETTVSSFAYGLPLDERSDLDLDPARWVDSVPDAWREARVEGSVALPDGAEARFWAVPRPGFGVVGEPLADLAAGLLRGGPAGRPAAPALPPGLLWVAYGADGRPVSTPWKSGTPPLAVLERAAGEAGSVATPAGRARFALAETAGGGAVAVLLPPLSSSAAFESTGMVAAGGLAAAALLTFAGAVIALPRPAARDLARRTVRSYSKRLVLVFTLLLIVPTALLYALLSRSLGQRIEREQAVAAEAALVSAQRVLGEYVLSLEPGFGLTTAIDDELLVWLSRVVQHEVSLYWGSEVYASSKRDLFAAGLLPRRIPGEAWERIALGGDALARRTRRAGGAEYVELYAPLEIPGAPAGGSRLFLAMPLLAQQEEAVAETGRIRRRALLATLALFLVLTASGSRLAASFTRPIEEFVAGTQRIAGGADRLGFRPAEAELEALAEAIDRMAATIAEGRERLVGEKLLVERIVENVTAGVVCLDRGGRVLIANRVARELLASAPGEALPERLARDGRLAPVAGFLAVRGDRPARAAVRLAGAAGDREWTLVWAPLEGPGDPAGLLVVEDVSEVLRGQRLEAWASMARIIAHEIKNPLTPIRLSAEHLREAWSRDREHFAAVFDRATTNILRQVEELREIASEFSIYSHVPRIDRQPGDLVATAREVAEAYRAAPESGVRVRFVSEADALPARFDAKLLPRALRNLVENAVRASAGRGEVEVRVSRRDGLGAIAVADSGPGVAPELLDRIFEPYFSTHSGGTGLGLPIARKIVEEHGGALAARNRASGGLEAVITIPLA